MGAPTRCRWFGKDAQMIWRWTQIVLKNVRGKNGWSLQTVSRYAYLYSVCMNKKLQDFWAKTVNGTLIDFRIRCYTLTTDLVLKCAYTFCKNRCGHVFVSCALHLERNSSLVLPECKVDRRIWGLCVQSRVWRTLSQNKNITSTHYLQVIMWYNDILAFLYFSLIEGGANWSAKVYSSSVIWIFWKVKNGVIGNVYHESTFWLPCFHLGCRVRSNW